MNVSLLRMMRIGAVVAAAALITACAGNKIPMYKRAEAVPPLEVPPDLTKPAEDPSFDIPQIGALLSKKVTLNGHEVRVMRDGRVHWLVIDADPADLWRRVQDFWVDASVNLSWQNPALGIMETDWITGAGQHYAKDKFRVRIEPGEQPGMTYLYLTHRGIQEQFADGQWVSVSGTHLSDPELEVEMLGRMLAFLGVEQKKVKEVTAEAAAAISTVTLHTEGDAYIAMDGTLFRAWQRVGLALDREGFEVLARDREQGEYKVNLPRPEGISPGFILGARPRQAFLIHVQKEGEQTRVTVASPDGEVSHDTATDILNRLYQQLQ